MEKVGKRQSDFETPPEDQRERKGEGSEAISGGQFKCFTKKQGLV